MNVAWALVADLELRGALFEDRGRDLGVIAPPGLLKPKEVETLRAHKHELLAFCAPGLRRVRTMFNGSAVRRRGSTRS